MDIFFRRAEVSPSIPNFQDYQSSTQPKGIAYYNKFVSFFLRLFSSISLDLSDKTVNKGSVTRYICERYLNLKESKTDRKIWDQVKATVEETVKETGKEAKQSTLDDFIKAVVENLAKREEIGTESGTKRNLAEIVSEAMAIDKKKSLEEATGIKDFLEKANKQTNILHPGDALTKKVQNRVLYLKLEQIKTDFKEIFPEGLSKYQFPKIEEYKNLDDNLSVLRKHLELKKRLQEITDAQDTSASSVRENLGKMEQAIVEALKNNSPYSGIRSDDVKGALDNLEKEKLKNQIWGIKIIPGVEEKSIDELQSLLKNLQQNPQRKRLKEALLKDDAGLTKELQEMYTQNPKELCALLQEASLVVQKDRLRKIIQAIKEDKVRKSLSDALGIAFEPTELPQPPPPVSVPPPRPEGVKASPAEPKKVEQPISTLEEKEFGDKVEAATENVKKLIREFDGGNFLQLAMNLGQVQKRLTDLKALTNKDLDSKRTSLQESLQFVRTFCAQAINPHETEKAIESLPDLTDHLKKLMGDAGPFASTLMTQPRFLSTINTLKKINPTTITQGLFTIEKGFLQESRRQDSPTDEGARRLATLFTELERYAQPVVQDREKITKNLDALVTFYRPKTSAGLMSGAFNWMFGRQEITPHEFDALESAVKNFKQKITPKG